MDDKTKPVLSPDQLFSEIERVCSEYHGQLDDLYEAIGLLAAGQVFGWRVMRLVAHRSIWRLATSLFGDLKQLMPERGMFAHRSIGLKMADHLDEYWKIVQGVVKIPQHERKATIDTI
jgi:hypothetical protein